MFQHILVPTDGSALSKAACERAIQLAKFAGARLTFLYARPERPVTFFAGEGGMFVDQVSPEDFDELARKQGDVILRDAMQKAQAQGIDCRDVAKTGAAPYEVIIDVATELQCDLILMASHGRTGVKAMILGSETQKVLTHSKIPVLVYR